ncbi:MAG: hypothetical protein H7281_03255 [Bacteriovorax sp.]|nr:hypothetical protein [Bacteriovorax sp.]
MNFYNKLLIYFNLKKRSAPDRENWIEYARFYFHPSKLLMNDSNIILLGLIIISIIYPLIILLVFFAIYYRVLSKFGDIIETQYDKGFEAQQIVYMIQKNHIQSLKEKFILNPNLIDVYFKKKSLLWWAKYYNNLPAHKMIIDLMKEKNIQKYKIA